MWTCLGLGETTAFWRPERDLIGWKLESSGGAEMQTTTANPMNDASSRSLEITIPSRSGEAITKLINSGYWGIPIEDETTYQCRFFLRPGTFSGEVSAALVAADGDVHASHTFGEISNSDAWREFKTTLTSHGSDPNGTLVLTFEGTGKLQVDFVSLFPPTFKDRPNGLRRDLAQYLADYGAAFLRWPGGCFVQGWSWDSAPDFRRTLGKPEERPGMYQYWKYRSTDGFGYHEFLQFSEDIGAEPVYVVFCGMTVHPEDNVPIEDIDPYIQNALDAIEYANGPVDSEWGAKRANMGHPEPFGLKHIEIGNEHLTPKYGDYYVRFREAIKKKHPDMNVIMTMYWSGLNRRAIERAGVDNIDMIDEHAYRDVNWIRSNFEYFDRYPRQGWTVFVGEYASQQDNGNWAGGLGDSLYLMMTERNGDLVKMACYAPLFRNVNDTTWPVNLIDFDSSRSYAHGSYYVQKTFNTNRPDVNLGIDYQLQTEANNNEPLMSGRVGLGAFDTQVEFRDLRIYDEKDELIYKGEFSDLSGWNAMRGDWTAEDGVLKQNRRRSHPAVILLEDLALDAGRIEVQARRTGGSEGFVILFGAEGINEYLFANYGANRNSFSALQERGKSTDGRLFRGGRSTRGPVEDNRWYDLEVKFDKRSAQMLLDGQLVSTGRMEILPSFFATAGLDREDQTVIIKATNYHEVPMTANIELDGIKHLSGEGTHIAIAGPGLRTDNDFELPQRIRPLTTHLPIEGTSLTVELPAYSVNILRLPIAP